MATVYVRQERHLRANLGFVTTRNEEGGVNNCFVVANLALNLSDPRCFVNPKQAIMLQQR